MWRDRWFAVAVIGAVLSCLACLTPLAVVVAAIGLGAWTGHVDLILLPVLIAFVVFAVYRARVAGRRAP